MLLDDIRHWQQKAEGECLVACCKMVLNYLGIEKSEEWLWSLLSAGDITPFTYVEKLSDALGLTVDMARWGELDALAPIIESGLPFLVAVDIDDPKYWPYSFNHAVVVVGFDAQRVCVNDPAHSDALQEIDRAAFLHAWSFRDYEYAVIRLADDA